MRGNYPLHALVVGGTSHTGERVVRRLRRVGVDVRVLTRHPESPIAKALALEGCSIAEGDCDRRWTVWRALEGCDALICCSHVKYAPVVVQAAQRMRVERLVCMSSTRRFSKVPDPTVGQVIRGETAITESGLDWTIVRCNMIYGGCRDNNLEKVVRWLRTRTWYPIVGMGRNLVQPVFVEDVVTGIQEVLHRPQCIGREYTLAGPQPMEYSAMIRSIAQALDRAVRLLYVPTSVAVAALAVGKPLLAPMGVNRQMLHRFAEDKTADTSAAVRDLDFRPHAFETALALKVAGQAEPDAIYGRSSSAVSGLDESEF